MSNDLLGSGGNGSVIFPLKKTIMAPNVSRLGSRDDLVPRWRCRPPDSSCEWAVAEVLGSGVGDQVVGVVG